MMRLLLLVTLIVGVVKGNDLLFEVRQEPTEEHIVCPDQNSKCPKTASCCQLSSGQWGCCPFAEASCCPDQEHCCPQGFSCNANKGQCVKAINNETIPWAAKQPSSLSASSESAVPGNSLTCPDRSVCAGTASCCRTYSGSFRCCTHPNSVCCSDGYTCCPRCTICDIVNKRCLVAFKTEEWKSLTDSTPTTIAPAVTPAGEKTAAMFAGDSVKELVHLVNVIYCNSTHYCQNYQTCCFLPTSLWGCCPYIHATCCAGSNYCCLPGKRCSHPAGSCI